MSPTVDGSHPEVKPDVARRMARIEWLRDQHGAGTLARMLVETEARVAELEREQLAREVADLARRVDLGATTERGAADRAAVVEGYRNAVIERDQLRRQAFDAHMSLIELVRAGRAGELSMHGLVPVTALVELLDRMGAPIMSWLPYGRPGRFDGAGADPEDPPVPPDGAR